MQSFMMGISSITSGLIGIIRLFDWIEVERRAKKERNLNFTRGEILGV